MSIISIIGLGTYARAIGTRGVEAGHAVEVIGRDAAKTKDLAAALGGGTTAGAFGTAPAGDIVILAVPYASAVAVVTQYGDALAGKVIIDISNTFTAADDTELVTPDGSSGAQGDRQGRPSERARREGVQHRLRPRPGPGQTARRALRRGRRAGKGERVGVHRDPRAAPTGCRQPGDGALAGRGGPADDGRWPVTARGSTSPSASTCSAERTRATISSATSLTRSSRMRVFVTGGTGHTGSYIIPELIAAGHEVTGLARSDAAAAAVSSLGAKVRRGDLEDLEGLMEAAADSDGVIHVAHRQDLLPFGGMDAVSAAELPVMLAYGEALAGTGKPLVAAGSIGSSGNMGRPATEEDPALPVGDEHKGTLRVRNVVETAVIDLAERGVRSSVVRIALIAHSTTDRAGFLPILIALAKEKGFAGYPGDGANLWNAVHARDVASLFRLALEKGAAGNYWHAVQDEGIALREIAESIGSHLDLPAVSIPVDELMVPGYFGLLANIVTQSYPASSLITRRTLGWEPAQPGLLADLDNGHYFPASSSVRDANDVPELSTEKIAQVVRSYIELAGHGSADGHRSADEVAALFADNAIFGPAGGDVQRGIEAIRSAYHSMWDGREQRVDLVSLNVSGGEAAVHVQVVFSGQRVDVIDVMTFDEDAKISSLRTYMGPSNVVTL